MGQPGQDKTNAIYLAICSSLTGRVISKRQAVDYLNCQLFCQTVQLEIMAPKLMTLDPNKPIKYTVLKATTITD